MTALVIRADARQLPLPDASVDLIVTSPPYFGQRSYQDGGQHYAAQIGAEPTPIAYIDALIDCTREWMRVLKPSGSIFVNLGDKYVADNRGSGRDVKRGAAKHAPTGPAGYAGEGFAPRKSLIGLPWRYAIRCVDDLGMTLRAELIWSKPNGMPESVTDRARRAHETWFHFTAGPRYFADLDQLREEHSPVSLARSRRNRFAPDRTQLGIRSANILSPNQACHPLGRLPGSVWEIATDPLAVPPSLGSDHFAAFPMEWPRRLIKGWSPVGGLVVDPFGGTGTTALVADALGRQGLIVDRSADYCRIAQWRTTDPAQRAKALGVSKPRAELFGQRDLFALVEERNDVG